MALPIYNSKEGHETPSLLDSIVGAMDEAWQTGTNWLEEKGTEFLESYDQSDDPFAQALKQGKGWSDLTDEEKDVFFSGNKEAMDTVFNFMGGGLGTITKSAGNLIYTGLPGLRKPLSKGYFRPQTKVWSRAKVDKANKQAEVDRLVKEVGETGNKPGAQPFQRPGGEVAKATDNVSQGMSPALVKASDGFAFNKGFDPIAYMREAKTPNQVMASWDAIRHKFSNYDVMGNGLKHGEHEAWAKQMYTMFAKALESQGLPTHAKIVMHQLSQRGNKVKQSYNSTVK